jgi:ribosomal protein S18 acetylase RimI-like enzyme
VIEIRPFEESDATSIVALSLRAWEPVHDALREVMGDELFMLRHQPDWRTRQQRDVESVLGGENNAVWVAEEGGVVVGFAAATIHDEADMGEIVMLAVDPPSQNRGIGTQLTRTATDWIRESGMPVAFISTGGENTGHDAARATYDKAGYRRLPISYHLKALRDPPGS